MVGTSIKKKQCVAERLGLQTHEVIFAEIKGCWDNLMQADSKDVLLADVIAPEFLGERMAEVCHSYLLERYSHILEMRYGKFLSLDEIAKSFEPSPTRSTIQFIIQKALRRIHREGEDFLLNPFSRFNLSTHTARQLHAGGYSSEHSLQVLSLDSLHTLVDDNADFLNIVFLINATKGTKQILEDLEVTCANKPDAVYRFVKLYGDIFIDRLAQTDDCNECWRYAKLTSFLLGATTAPVVQIKEEPDFKSISLERLHFSTRVHNVLICAGMHTLGDIAEMSADELMKCRNCGLGTLNEVRSKLAEYGLELAEPES